MVKIRAFGYDKLKKETIPVCNNCINYILLFHMNDPETTLSDRS
mgnify:CR=1 FL=1